MTDLDTKSKRRRRVLEPLSEGYASKPFTAKHRANLVPLTHANAVQFLSDYEVGYDSREQYEMAYRLSLKLSGDAQNPLLTKHGTLQIVQWTDYGVKIRVSSVMSDQGQIFLAMRILRPIENTSILDAAAGIGFLTLAENENTIAFPSTFDVENPLPQAERDILINFIAATQGPNADELNRKLRIAFAEGYLNPV